MDIPVSGTGVKADVDIPASGTGVKAEVDISASGTGVKADEAMKLFFASLDDAFFPILVLTANGFSIVNVFSLYNNDSVRTSNDVEFADI